jgi:hypothetical protein
MDCFRRIAVDETHSAGTSKKYKTFLSDNLKSSDQTFFGLTLYRIPLLILYTLPYTVHFTLYRIPYFTVS